MKYKKGYLVILITIASIVINLLGRDIASKYNLPVWLDSFGTILIAYIYGPVCGGIVGLVNNIIYGIFVDEQSVYCFVGLIIGVVTGLLAKRGAFKSPFEVMTLGAELALICTAIAVPLNVFLYDGKVGNIWADQIILMSENNGTPKLIAYCIAQFYIEFLDKLITVFGIYLLIILFKLKDKLLKKGKKSTVSILFGILILSLFNGFNSMAGNDTDYDSYTQTVYSTDDGLLAGEANDIAETKEGQLWIGTYAGLYSYDGITFTAYNNIDSVKNVNELYVDEEGRLWIGTNDNGVTMMINGKVMNVIDTEDGLLSNSIKSIVCDSNGYYYIGSSSGISIITLSGGVEVYKEFADINNTIKLTADKNGNVIAVTDDREVYFFKDSELVNKKVAGLIDKGVTTAFFAGDDSLYFGLDDNSVLIYGDASCSDKQSSIICENMETLNSFYEMTNGDIFVCSDSGVGYIDTNGTFTSINTDKFTSSIDNMLVDYQGDIWFSSSRLGLLKLCKSAFASLFNEVSEEARVVNAVQYYKGNMLCGTDNGLLIIDEAGKKSIENELTDLFKDVRIRHIYVDKNDNIWISTTGSGLYKIVVRGKGYDITNFDDSNGMPGKRVRCCKQLSSGEMIAVGDDGIAFISGDKVVKTITDNDELINKKSLCIIEYKDRVYVGSDGGGITVINYHSIESRITKADGLSSDVILRMIYDEATDGVFIVTSNGLCYMSSEGEISYLDNFPYSNNYDIIHISGGKVWVLGSAGIYIAESDKLVENISDDYDLINTKRGFKASITANSYSCVNDNSVYICCDTDVVKVDMTDYNFSAQSYRMILKYINVDGINYEVSRTQPLYLDSYASNIVIDPKILNYSLNDPYISYSLSGVDSEEKVMLLSELKPITYSNLKPGKYTFKIAVLDNSKENVIESGSYTIIKDMEMYQNGWFKLYFFVVGSLIVIWLTWFVTKKSVQKTVLEQKLELDYAKKQIEMGNETILSIARTVDAKDPNTSEHSFRVSEYSVAIARRYGFNEEKCENIRQMALLHDIGKIGIPDAILNKPGKLDDDEYSIMKSHVIRGGDILKDFTLIENVRVGALYHHERYDGKGYCSGLKGEEIPIEARIIGIADAFDAMTANRVYRKKLDMDVVLEELKRCSGYQFDPKLTDILLELIDEKVIDMEQLYKDSKANSVK